MGRLLAKDLESLPSQTELVLNFPDFTRTGVQRPAPTFLLKCPLGRNGRPSVHLANRIGLRHSKSFLFRLFGLLDLDSLDAIDLESLLYQTRFELFA
jgi:hypothetical protein